MNRGLFHPANLKRGRVTASRGWLTRALALALVVPVGAAILSSTGQTQTPAKAAPLVTRGLEGAWSGAGSVTFATGSKEAARCRALYRRAAKDSYRMQATCATASGRADQTATVHKIGENRYRGNFHNPDFDIKGTIFVVVNGNSQSVRLTSSSGSALINLRR